ncbi:MAG: carbamoyltransferase HypF, partial [Acidaminococcaceae bacterium]|nr:carbamoyltransferase HypF [Acidaminococcaceae bacterium]
EMKQNVTVAIIVYGKVQGVGFRPLVCRLAKDNKLTGFVRNAGTHVEITATGLPDDIQQLCDSLVKAELPVRVEKLLCETVSHQAFDKFISVASTENDEVKSVSADIGICENCLHELKENDNRRKGYSYISCAQCGPRYTIIRKLPYDRVNTTMEQFALCDDCAEEYGDMQNRRGHGETISCYHCGPQLQCVIKEEYKNGLTSDCIEGTLSANSFSDSLKRQAQDKQIISVAGELLKQGRIIMVKAVGGFNLLCRADKAEVVTRLRDLKKRMSKPFAVMVTDIALAENFCYVSAEEKVLLQSAARPIVLCQKKQDAAAWLAENVTDVSDQVGVFLPSMGFYSELDTEFPFIVTSCNYTGQPIIYKDEEAQRFFDAHKNIAALFTYEREILRPADDAVTRVVNGKVQILRRTKGYMPEPVAKADPEANVDVSHNNNHILALGAQMEPGFCLTAEGSFFPAEIPGDVSLEKTEQFFANSVQDWTELLSIKPQAVAGDLHPGYATAQWGKMFAEKNGLPFYQVQHHHAHALAVMAEHHLKGNVLAVCFDGTGLGADGTVWGGEFLLCEGSRFTRVGHLKTISMLGGDVSMQQAWKTALCHLAAAGLHSCDPRFAIVKKALQQNVNAIQTSSMGRLFDAAASLLGLADFNSHQGRCAMALESAARIALREKIQPLPLAFAIEEERDENSNTRRNDAVNAGGNGKNNLGKVVFNPAPLWNPLCKARGNEASVRAAALGFHYAVVSMVTDMAERMGVKQVVLAGGCFANRILLETCTKELQERGFLVYYNEAVSPGDGGISLGQAYYGYLI